MIKIEEQFFRTMGLLQQPISDTKYLEMIVMFNKLGYPISGWYDFDDANTMAKLRSSILRCVMETYKWYDSMDNVIRYNDKIKKAVKKIFKGEK